MRDSSPPTQESWSNPPPWLQGGLLPFLLCLALLFSGSTPTQAQSLTLDGYDFSKDGGEQIKLASGLREISGLAMDSAGRLFAHNDERAVIYQLDPVSGQVLKAFYAGFNGTPGDFEGIAIAGRRIFLSNSNGEILETGEGSHGSTMDYRFHSLGLGDQCEFEGLAFDSETGSLLLPCKEPREKDLRDHILVFSVDLRSMEPARVPRIFLPIEELEALDLDPSFSPSGIAIHPETGSIYLVSAQDDAVLEFSAGGTLLGGRSLRKKTHAQTEGIAFETDGTLLLADEGREKRGRLTRYTSKNREGGEAR
jgi:uncharacterized protein YjiK